MRSRRCPAALLASVLIAAAAARASESGEQKTSRISDDAVPLIEPESIPNRPRPLIEIGDPFLGSGRITSGFEIPGGAVWQPSFIVFGALRTALQSFDAGAATSSEWANRLDLFGNLQLTGTERVVVGFRPLERPGSLAGYRFAPGAGRGAAEDWNTELQALFFEGDLGELFPNAASDGGGPLDVGFAVGRQPFLPQEGVLMADSIDALGVTRNTLLPRGGSDMQLTAVWGWNGIHRADRIERDGVMLFGMMGAADYPKRTLNLDTIWVHDRERGDDGLYWGLSSVQRVGHLNTTFRVLGSHALGEESLAVTTGLLVMGELSWTPAWTHDIAYVNAFWGVDRFSSAARDPGAGGPLARVGMLFSPLGLGAYGSPLLATADRAAGGAAGYQAFLDGPRRQLVVEAGFRAATDGGDVAGGLGARLSQALGRRFVIQLDAFGSWAGRRHPRWGTRLETLIRF